MKSLVNGSTTTCKVIHVKSNQYRIQYMPTLRGHHELRITLNGQKVDGSPFPVFISIHPSQLKMPVSIITNLKGPRCVATNSIGETAISDLKTILVFDKIGEN